MTSFQDLAPLDELGRQRAEFLEMVSHELRAPLISIKGSTATAPHPAELLQIFRIIDGQADHMRGLIANLLDAGSIEAGTLTVAPVVVDLPPDRPQTMVDPQRIGQVLNNLLANAARHSPPSAPMRVEGAVEGTHIALSVSDQGRGIVPDRLPYLFRKRAGLTGDTGLGLAISKGLVEAHGDRIRAESGGPGLGARFTFTIPSAAHAAAATTPPGSFPRPPGTKGREQRVVVLDDD